MYLFSPLPLQVFDVVLNGDLTIASDLDIFDRVGRGVAHDEYIEFEVKSGKILNSMYLLWPIPLPTL